MNNKRKALLVPLTYMRAWEKSGNAGNFQDFPYGVLSIATYCRDRCSDQAEIEVLDLAIESYNPEEYLNVLNRKITAFKPDIVGFSIMFDNAYRFLLNAVQLVKRWNNNTVIVLGGSAVSSTYKSILNEQKNVDAICYSEGEIPFLELLKCNDLLELLESHGSWITKKSLTVSCRPPMKALVHNLDEVIDIDYSFVDINKYDVKSSFVPTIEKIENPKQFPLVTSRGCPFKCTFCWHSGDNDTSMRYASVDKIIEHLERLASKYGLNTIVIWDDQILLNRKRAKDLFKKLSRFKCRIECPNGLAVCFIDDELAKLMYQAGLRVARLAIESGSPYVLNKLINKHLKLHQVKRVIDILRKHNFWIIGFFVVGMPGETDVHRQETINFINDIGLDWSVISIALPSKGSILWEQSVRNGYIEDKAEFVEYGLDKNVISTPDYSAAYIEKAAYLINLNVNFVNNYRAKIGEYDVATSYFIYLITTYPKHAFAHYYLSKCLAETGDRRGAEEYMHNFEEIIHNDIKWMEYSAHFGLSVERVNTVAADA